MQNLTEDLNLNAYKILSSVGAPSYDLSKEAAGVAAYGDTDLPAMVLQVSMNPSGFIDMKFGGSSMLAVVYNGVRFNVENKIYAGGTNVLFEFDYDPIHNWKLGNKTGWSFGYIRASQQVDVELTTGVVWSFGNLSHSAQNRGLLAIKYAAYYQMFNNGVKSSDFSINFANGQNQAVELGASVNVTSLDFPGVGTYHLKVKQPEEGGKTISFPSYVLAPGGKATGLVLSTAGYAVDVITFLYDGVNALAMVAPDFKP